MDLSARRTVDLTDEGNTRRGLRSLRWDAPTYGVRLPAGHDLDEADQRIAVAAAVMNERCVLGGWAALRAMGNWWFDGDGGSALVHCEPGAQLRVRPGIRPTEGLLHPDEVLDLSDLRVATPARAAYDEMCRAGSLSDAVVAADMATSTTTGAPHTSIEQIGRVLASHHKVRGIVRAREALALASSRSASPWESKLRLFARTAGLTALGVNVPVFSPAGTLLGVVDLLDEESGLVLESDGGHHREAEQHAADNVKEEALERAGLVVVRVSSLDHQDPAKLAWRIRSARIDAGRSIRRAWTTDPPAWWYSWPTAARWR